MKKYSSYADLKIGPNQKPYPVEYWPNKITNTPSSRKGFEMPLTLISKQPFAIPMTAKYSAGYLQRKKMFSSRKENKDSLNVKSNATNATNTTNLTNNMNQNITGQKIVNDYRVIQTYKPNNSKTKKVGVEESQKSNRKQKMIRLDKHLQLENKQNQMNAKPYRFQVQSPKGIVNKVKQQKEKSKSKLKQKEKEKTLKPVMLANFSKNKDKKQKQQDGLKDYVTKYQQQPKNILLHCTSESNLLKVINLQERKSIKGYYKAVIYNAFFSTKASSFFQICKNHLVTSIQFLSYAKRNKQLMPQTFNRVNLPNTNKKTLIFDLDETLIHCNQSLQMPHDVALEIVFPNNSKIKAGINIRPYAVECLKELSKYFQIIVFTASHQCYANVIIDYLDPKKEYVSHRFFRETCHKTQEGFYVKDLRVFGRDLSNVLLIDNAAYSYCFQPQNGVPIIPFYSNKADLELKQATVYLKEFVDAKNMRTKNENYMKLSEYHRFACPKQLINQLYF